MNLFNIKRAYDDMIPRGWDTIYICIDVHDVILEGKYNRHNVGAQYMPNALEVLRQWTKRPEVRLILWSCSYDDATKDVLAGLADQGVKFDYINENPECPDTEMCNFSKKFYFNVLLDDKAGFEGATDWHLIEKELKKIGKWDLLPGHLGIGLKLEL